MQSKKWKTRALEAGDVSYITSTWMNSYRSNNQFARDMKHRIFSAEHNRIINAILSNAEVLLAVDPQDPNHIFGYVVFQNLRNIDLDVFHYIYIKAPLQKNGVAKDLIEMAQTGKKAVYTQKNQKAQWIADKLLKNYNEVNYNPYLFFKEI